MAIPGISNIGNAVNQGGSSVLGTLGKVTSALSTYNTAKEGFQKGKQEWQQGMNPYDAMLGNKTAFEKLDGLTQEKEAATDIGKAFQVGLQKGVKALPATAAVLGASYLVNRNLKGDMAPVRPTNAEIKDQLRYELKKRKLDKEAAYTANPEPWGQYFKNLAKDAPQHMAEGLGVAIPAAALTLALGKNIRGRGETIPTRQPEYKKKMLLKKYKPYNKEEN